MVLASDYMALEDFTRQVIDALAVGGARAAQEDA